MQQNSAATHADLVIEGWKDNQLINGGFDFGERVTDPGVAVSMTDGGFNVFDRWYSLIQGSGATVAQVAGVKARHAARLAAGGTTNRFGIAQIVESFRVYPLRSEPVVFRASVTPNLNAGSGTMDVRAAILAWTGQPDAFRNLRDAQGSWVASGSGTNEYYYNVSGLTEPANVCDFPFASQVTLGAGTAGSLTADQWDWADNDSLGFNTIYVRFTDGSDPDDRPVGAVYARWSILDVVNDWTSGTYTAGNFFGSTSLSLVATAQKSITHDTETDLDVTGTVPSGATNLIVLLWHEDVPAHAADYLDATKLRLHHGSIAQPWRPRMPAEELAICQRFYERITTAKGNRYTAFGSGQSGSTTRAIAAIPFKVEKRVRPSVVNVSSTSSPDDRWAFYNSTITDWIAWTTMNSAIATEWGFLFDANVASGLTAGQCVLVNSYQGNALAYADADAEIGVA